MNEVIVLTILLMGFDALATGYLIKRTEYLGLVPPNTSANFTEMNWIGSGILNHFPERMDLALGAMSLLAIGVISLVLLTVPIPAEGFYIILGMYLMTAWSHCLGHEHLEKLSRLRQCRMCRLHCEELKFRLRRKRRKG